MKIKKTFHRLQLPCPKCSHQMTVLEISVNADGYLSIEGVCVFCAEERESLISLISIVGECAQQDLVEPIARLEAN